MQGNYRSAIVQRVYIMKQTKILCGQLICLVELADVSTRYSSHPQGNYGHVQIKIESAFLWVFHPLPR